MFRCPVYFALSIFISIVSAIAQFTKSRKYKQETPHLLFIPGTVVYFTNLCFIVNKFSFVELCFRYEIR